MKRAIASSIIGAASVAFILPFAFSAAVEGCDDADYLYATQLGTESQVQAAAQAKSQFCRVVGDANRLYR